MLCIQKQRDEETTTKPSTTLVIQSVGLVSGSRCFFMLPRRSLLYSIHALDLMKFSQFIAGFKHQFFAVIFLQASHLGIPYHLKCGAAPYHSHTPGLAYSSYTYSQGFTSYALFTPCAYQASPPLKSILCHIQLFYLS